MIPACCSEMVTAESTPAPFILAVMPGAIPKPDRSCVTRTGHIVCQRHTRLIPIDSRTSCSYYVPIALGSRRGRSDVAFESRRSIFDIVYLSQKDRRPQTGRPTRSRPRIAPLTSFTWGCSSDSKKNRTSILTYPLSALPTERCVRVEFRILRADPPRWACGSSRKNEATDRGDHRERSGSRPHSRAHSFSVSSVSLW